MPSGGVRTGRPGVAYPQRSDLTGNPRSPSTSVHGDVAKREQVVRATPDQPGPPRPTGGPMPGQLTSLDAPTERPNEPVTAGLPMGAGPGPEALTPMPVADDGLYELRALVARNPQYRDLARIIALAEENQ